MEEYKINLDGDILEQVNELNPYSISDFQAIFNEVWDNCITILYIDNQGYVYSRGIHIAKCKL